MFESPAAVMACLTGIAALFFLIEARTKWKIFNVFPPLIWIYATPLILSNTGVLPAKSPAYDMLGTYGLPIFIVLLLVGVNVGAAFRIMGKGVLVMLMGTVGIVVGAPVGYFVAHQLDVIFDSAFFSLSPEAWRGFGALAGSWIGGTGNMMAVAGGLETPPEILGLAVLADNAIYVVWLPILLGSKAFAKKFNQWTGADHDRVAKMEAAAKAEAESKPEIPLAMRHFLYFGLIGLAAAALSQWIAPMMPQIEPILSTSTWRILLVTTGGIALSFTAVRDIPHSHEVAMAIVYVFVAGMGARASLSGLAQAPAFLIGAAIWITIHGLFCLAGAWLFKVDVHSAAIASAANVGGAASAPVVAAYHRESLVPASILMALIGYAVGNYMAFVAAWLCKFVGGA